MQNLVINIGDVTDKCYVVAGFGQPAAQNIEVNT